jgi:flagellar assembly protein FliH
MQARILGQGEASATVRYAWSAEKPALEPEPLPQSQPDPEPKAEPQGPTEIEQLHARIALLDREAEERARESYAAGVRDGQVAAADQFAPHIETLEQRYEKTVNDIAVLRAQIVKQAEQDVVRLALDIARRILHQELETNRQALDNLVRVALERLSGRQIVRLRVHPDVEAATREALGRIAARTSLEVLADASLEPGSILFESADGRLDAGLESQMREIERAMAGTLENQP